MHGCTGAHGRIHTSLAFNMGWGCHLCCRGGGVSANRMRDAQVLLRAEAVIERQWDGCLRKRREEECGPRPPDRSHLTDLDGTLGQPHLRSFIFVVGVRRHALCFCDGSCCWVIWRKIATPSSNQAGGQSVKCTEYDVKSGGRLLYWPRWFTTGFSCPIPLPHTSQSCRPVTAESCCWVYLQTPFSGPTCACVYSHPMELRRMCALFDLTAPTQLFCLLPRSRSEPSCFMDFF